MLKAREEVKTSYWYRLNEYSINLFFGIGVIYTAIGMQSALSSSLSGLDEQLHRERPPDHVGLESEYEDNDRQDVDRCREQGAEAADDQIHEMTLP